MEVSAGSALSKTRRTWFSVMAVVFALIFGIGFFSWIGLVTGWFETGDRQIHRVHDIASSGVATGLLIAVPLLILAWRRDDIALLQMLGVAGLATVIGSVLATEPEYAVFVVIIAVPVVVLLAISRGWHRYVEGGQGWAAELLVAAIVAAPFWGAFAWTMARYQADLPSDDPHVQEFHWLGMAVMAIGLVLMAVLAALRTQGWRIVAWLTGAGSIVYGAASIAFATYPGSDVPYPSSEGSFWGALAIAWGVVLIALAERRARATR
jgi:hypothetical protein